MTACQNGSDTAVVILHEIYGINAHIKKVCREYSAEGYDVYCTNLLKRKTPFPYSQQEDAYRSFIRNIGFDAYLKVNQFLEELRPNYKALILIGFSVGATIAWRCSESGLCDGIIGYYGSRIRDYLSVVPKCKTLLIFAEDEQSVGPEELAFTDIQMRNTLVNIDGV